jgi:hypothetical protein
MSNRGDIVSGGKAIGGPVPAAARAREMDAVGTPEIVREKTTRLTGGRLACTLILERELTVEEIRRFYAVPSDDAPRAIDFQLEGRIVRYDCSAEDEAKWRLAAQIFLVKSFRAAAPVRRTTTDVRRRMGLPSLHN